MRRDCVKSLALRAMSALMIVMAALTQGMSQPFTYQGFLKESGNPANGAYDFQFRLFPEGGGSQVGPTVTVNDLNVQNGLFTTELDFGSVWDGSARYLEIAVRPGSSTGAYTTLSPRVKITRAPYSQYAFTTPWSGISGMPAGFADGIDNDTTYSAGAGLQLVGTTFSIATGGVATSMLADLSVTTVKIADGAVTDAKLSNTGVAAGTYGSATQVAQFTVNAQGRITSASNVTISGVSPGGAAGGDLSGTYPNPTIAANVVNSSKLASDAASLFKVSGGVMSSSSGDILFGDDQSSIIFPAADATNSPMMFMFAAGVSNGDRMVIAHSPPYPTWGLQYQDVGDKFNFLSAGTPVMTVDLGVQRVGIGTTSPDFILDVNGRARIRGTTGVNTAGIWYSNGTDLRAFIGLLDDYHVGLWGIGAAWQLVMNTMSGNVSIGPYVYAYPIETAKLNVNTDSYLDHATLRLHELGNDGPRIEFTNSVNTARKWHIWGYIGAAVSDDRLNFWNSQAGDIMSIRGDGTVSVRVLEITGADFAEKFPTTDTVEPGMVVEIDPDHPGNLRKARGAYNRRVVGVVAGANGLSKGIILGNLEGSEHHTPIAISGRVWVYADATERAIEPGDFLTTAERPGYAMKADDLAKAQGAILGKAMTRLEKGKTGLVLVVVNLQ